MAAFVFNAFNGGPFSTGVSTSTTAGVHHTSEWKYGGRSLERLPQGDYLVTDGGTLYVQTSTGLVRVVDTDHPGPPVLTDEELDYVRRSLGLGPEVEL